MGTVRRQARIARSADDVWAVISDPVTIAQWFPGIVDATVDGTTRVVTTASGIPMPEEIITNDAIQRRFQYRLTARDRAAPPRARSTCSISATAPASSPTPPTASPMRWRSSSAAPPATRSTS